MSPIEKKVMYGVRQEAVLSPKEGFEVESVEVFNKTTNEVVPSQLTKTSEVPARWTCSFCQPAGVVVIRPKLKPIFYSVIIEECENCCVVLLESDETVDIQMSAPSNENSTGEDSAPAEVVAETSESETHTDNDGARLDAKAPSEAAGAPEGGDDHSADSSEEATSDSSVEQGASGPAALPQEAQEGTENFNNPQHSIICEEHADEAEDVEVEGVVTEAESAETEAAEAEDSTAEGRENREEQQSQDAAYDAGEFASELEDVEPTVISREEYDRKCRAFWKIRDAYNSGSITLEKFEEVKAKHMKFMNDVSLSKIVVEEQEGN